MYEITRRQALFPTAALIPLEYRLQPIGNDDPRRSVAAQLRRFRDESLPRLVRRLRQLEKYPYITSGTIDNQRQRDFEDIINQFLWLLQSTSRLQSNFDNERRAVASVCGDRFRRYPSKPIQYEAQKPQDESWYAFLNADGHATSYRFKSRAFLHAVSRLREDLYTIWNWIGEKPVVADLSPQMLRQVSDCDLVQTFSRMPKFAYYRAVESLFIMYPLAPVSVLTVRQQNAWRFEEGGSRVSAGIYGGWLSCICGTLMEQLANNYCEQAFKIACLPQIYGDGIALSAGQFCNVLCQKALCVLTARES